MSLKQTVTTKYQRYIRGINEFKKGYLTRTKLTNLKMVICLHIPAIFWTEESLVSY